MEKLYRLMDVSVIPIRDVLQLGYEFPLKWMEDHIHSIYIQKMIFAKVFDNRKNHILNSENNFLLVFIKDKVVEFFEGNIIYIDTFDLVMENKENKIHINCIDSNIIKLK